jgi:predicted transglutaminase-like cysteine proteinase
MREEEMSGRWPRARAPVVRLLLIAVLYACLAGAAGATEAKEESGGEEKPGLFGTVEFRRPIGTLPDWLKALERHKANSIFKPGVNLSSSTSWEDFKARAETLSPLEKLKTVNTFWNKWPYREDIEVYKIPDYWAAPYEFRKNSGDCEDYSIAKYFTLRELGFSPDDMRVVVVMETIRNLAHAVLAVYLDGDIYILDNLNANVVSHTRLRNYDPQYSVNEKNRWAHVRPKKGGPAPARRK